MHSTILTDLIKQFLGAAAAWYQSLLPVAKSLFLMLASIELTWTAAWSALERDDLNPVFIELIRRLLRLGFFWTVLLRANLWVPAVIEGFVAAGKRAAAAAGANLQELNPSTVIDQGVMVSSSVWNGVNSSGWLSALAGALLAALVSLLIFLAFVMVAANLVIALVEMCVVIGGGVLLLGFAGSSWTLPFAERYLSLAVSTGVKLFLLYLIIGLGTALAASWQPEIASAGQSASDFFQVLAGALVYAFVAWNVPAYASALLGGSVATHLDTWLRSTAVGASWAFMPLAAAHGAAQPAVRLTAAMVEAGRLAGDYRRSGGSLAGAVVHGGVSLGTSAARATYHRLSGEHRFTTAAYLRDLRTARSAVVLGGGSSDVSPTVSVEPASERRKIEGSKDLGESVGATVSSDVKERG
jgi:type IV secretion system protein TrbL